MKITIQKLRSIIKESMETEPFTVTTLYHGTTAQRAEEIMASGFSLDMAGEKSGAAMPGISTSTQKETAEEHAEWAAEKFNDDPQVVLINGRGLQIAPGSLYFSKWDELGSSDASIKNIKDSGVWDGVALFDPETGDGIEEYEVLLFNPSSIKIIG